jgi:hypothetical protein
MPDESKIKGDGRVPYPRFVNLSVNGYKTATSMILTAWLEKFPKQKKTLALDFTHPHQNRKTGKR